MIDLASPDDTPRTPRIMPNLGNKTALITGASRGMGRATALALAAAGARVIVHYNRNAVEAKTVVDQIRAAGGRASAGVRFRLIFMGPKSTAPPGPRTARSSPTGTSLKSLKGYEAAPMVAMRRNSLAGACRATTKRKQTVPPKPNQMARTRTPLYHSATAMLPRRIVPTIGSQKRKKSIMNFLCMI
jgi:hypothetical protein